MYRTSNANKFSNISCSLLNVSARLSVLFSFAFCCCKHSGINEVISYLSSFVNYNLCVVISVVFPGCGQYKVTDQVTAAGFCKNVLLYIGHIIDSVPNSEQRLRAEPNPVAQKKSLPFIVP